MTGQSIFVLQRGWVVVGDVHREGSHIRLTNASVIRRWGTDKGLGQLALEGKRPQTTLDPCGEVSFHELTSVMEIPCQTRL